MLTSFPSDNATAGTAFAQQPVVDIVDTLGTRTYAASGTHLLVTAFVSGNPGLLGGVTSVITSAGQAHFTDLSLQRVGIWEISFNFSDVIVASGPVLVTSGTPAAVELLDAYHPGMNGSNYGGLAWPVQPRVRVTDVGRARPSLVGTRKGQKLRNFRVLLINFVHFKEFLVHIHRIDLMYVKVLEMNGSNYGGLAWPVQSRVRVTDVGLCPKPPYIWMSVLPIPTRTSVLHLPHAECF